MRVKVKEGEQVGDEQFRFEYGVRMFLGKNLGDRTLVEAGKKNFFFEEKEINWKVNYSTQRLL